MRLGKTPRTRGWPKAGEHSHYITRETRIGQVSADLMATYFQPRIIQELASDTLERYAAEWLAYKDAIGNATRPAEMEIGPDGSLHDITSGDDATNLPVPPRKPLFHSPTQQEEVDEIFTDISEHFFSRKNAGWRIHVNAAKFERQMDEKYGMFRPFLEHHPAVERSVRNLQRQYNRLTVFRTGPPPIPRGTAVILLFLLQRGKVRWDVLLLAALFLLVGLQPWALVVVVCIVQGWLQRRKYTPVGRMERTVPELRPYWDGDEEEDREVVVQRKRDILLRPVGQPLGGNSTTGAASIDTSQFDALLIGTGPSTLYAGALLSRAGRKVLVLSSADDASGCVTLDPTLLDKDNIPALWKEVPFDIDNCSIAKLVSGQQALLAPALATTQDRQGGLRFAQIGSNADGYTTQILSVPGLGVGDGKSSVPFLVQTGMTAVMEAAAEYLGDTLPPMGSDESGGVMVGDSLTGQYLQSCRKLNEGAGYFFLSKILPESVTKLSSSSGDSSTDGSAYKNASIRPSSSLLNACFPLNPQLRSLMAAIGMSGENRPPSTTSLAAHLSTICSTVMDGMHYPVGGPRALCHALASTICQSGGRVVTQANVRELLFDASLPHVPHNHGHTVSSDATSTPPCCVGVALSDGTKIRFAAERYNDTKQKNSSLPVVVSLEGFIPTFIRYLPDDIRTEHKVPRGLPALSERRPLVHFLFGLRGSAADLNVTGADYIRLPNAAVPHDQVDPATGAVTFGEIGRSSKQGDEDVAVEGEGDEVATTTPGDGSARRTKGCGVHFELGSSWMRITFPSAKDPSFRERHGDITTCVVTIEADDDLVTEFDTKPRIFAVKRSAGLRNHLTRMESVILQELLSTYPQLEGHIVHQQLRGPYVAGLANNPERYAAMGIRAASPYPCLYAGGSDLTVGNTFSGGTVGAWLVANAVCGYNAIDHLVLQKNITSDLERFLPPSYEVNDDEDDEHLAVPFTQDERSTNDD